MNLKYVLFCFMRRVNLSILLFFFSLRRNDNLNLRKYCLQGKIIKEKIMKVYLYTHAHTYRNVHG